MAERLTPRVRDQLEVQLQAALTCLEAMHRETGAALSTVLAQAIAADVDQDTLARLVRIDVDGERKFDALRAELLAALDSLRQP